MSLVELSLVLDSYSKCFNYSATGGFSVYLIWHQFFWVNTEHVGAFVIRLFLFCFFLIVLNSFLLIFLYLSIDFIFFLRFQLLLLFLIITTIFDFCFILIFSRVSTKGQKWYHDIFLCRSLFKKKNLRTYTYFTESWQCL